MKRSLIALALATFTLGVAEFGMMGFLSSVAEGLDISITGAGHLISAYSLGVAVGSLLLVVLRRMPLKKLTLLLAATIFVGNLAAMLAPSYHTLLIARVISGLPHGAFFGAGAIVCTRISQKGRGAQAVATMIGGMTVANLIGVPAATFLSNTFGWRAPFAMITLCALTACICIRAWLPYLAPLPDNGIKGQLQFLRRLDPWLIYAGVFFGQASVYCWLSYIDPIMTDVTHFSPADLTWIMMLVGAGMIAGNYLAGKLADRYTPAKVCSAIALLLIIIMPAVYLLAPHKLPSLLLAFIASAALFGIGGPLQYLIVKYSRGGEMLGGAGIQIAFNTSNAMSAAVGGALIHAGYSLASPALIGLPFATISAIALLTLTHREKARQ